MTVSNKKQFMLSAATAFTVLMSAVIQPTQAYYQDSEPDVLRNFSIHAPYIDYDLQSRWFDFGGDAIINTHRYVRLTQDMASQNGWLWSRYPMEAENFQVEVEFQIGGRGEGVVGDGMALWLTKERAEIGPVFGNRDYFTGLGIFLDTYANARQAHSFPYVMAMNGDGRTKYDHDRDGLQNRIGGCEADIRGKEFTGSLRLSYYRKTGIVNVKLQTRGDDVWDDCFTLTGVQLPAEPYLGFTAGTGEVHDNHDVVAVRTSLLAKAEEFVNTRKNNTPPPSLSSGGSAIKYILGSVVFVGVIFGFYKMSQKSNNAKRF